jgi:hypothetical protein
MARNDGARDSGMKQLTVATATPKEDAADEVSG